MGNRILKSFYAAQTVQGNPEQPVTIHLQWSSTPEWRPSVTVNQPINHITTSTESTEEIRQLKQELENVSSADKEGRTWKELIVRATLKER